MYGKLGRMTGRSYEDTVHTLIKGLKSAESQTRAETFIAFGRFFFKLDNVQVFMN